MLSHSSPDHLTQLSQCTLHGEHLGSIPKIRLVQSAVAWAILRALLTAVLKAALVTVLLPGTIQDVG